LSHAEQFSLKMVAKREGPREEELLAP